ncbi:hypothetical protein AB0J21_10960 [Streptomyces sp. NPDC049954]|uniref:hypothetical protein n=1 Tax=Streptomyces sp. NPDC049954 TaxID=3155779 RepID=UPI00342AFFCE
MGGNPNHVFRAIRETEWQCSRTEAAKRIVQKSIELGEPVSCVARTLTTWEDGTTRCPRPVYLRILRAMTGRNATALGFTPPYAALLVPGHAPRLDEGTEDMLRRTLMAGTAAAIPSAALHSGHAPALGQRHVETLLAAEQRLYAHDSELGSADLSAEAVLGCANWWLGHGRYSPATGRALQTATGRLAVAAGWIALDSGHTTEARSLYTEALVNARQVDDPALEAHAFGCLSLLATATGHPREAIGTAQVAQRAVAGLGSPRWLSLLHCREARGWALQGDARATGRALATAYRLYEEGTSEADPDWLGFYTPAELAGLESLCLADLHQYDRACAGAEQAVLLQAPHHHRNRALYTADLALLNARKDKPDLDAATAAAREALAQLPQVGSSRLMHSLDRIAEELAPHRSVSSVAAYLDACAAA